MDDDSGVAVMEQEMRDSGVATDVPMQQDYFGFEQTDKVYLPDKKSYIEHRVLNEGARRKYLNETNKSVRVQRATGDAIMKMAAGDDRHALMEAAICGWNLVRNGEPVPFNDRNLKEFLKLANPKIIDDIEKAIRKHNPWLMAEVTLEDIDSQIEELKEMRQQKLDEMEGNDTSPSK